MNVLIYNLKVVYFLLICSIESYIIPIQDIYSEEGKGSVKQIPKNIKHSKGYPYFESSRKLRRSRDVLDYEYNIFTPEFKVQSYQTKSYAYEEFIQNEEDELQLPRGFVEKNEIDIKNTINSPLQIIKHSQTQKMCAEEVKFTNDIAALFHQQIDIPRSIFPLCCKTLAPKIRTTECTTPLETKLTSETIPLHFSTQTSSSNKAPSTTPIEELSTALVALTTVTNTFIFVSSQAVLNIMLHVNCDDHGTSELSVFNPTEHKVTGQLSMKSTVQSHAQTTQTNCLDNSLNVALDTNQLSCLQEETVQKRTENNPFKYQDSSMKHKTIPSFEKASQNAMSTSNTKKMTTCQYIPISKKRKEMYTCDHLEITDKSDTEINSFQTLRSTKTIKEKKRTEHKVITKGSKHLKTAHHHALGPRPLQPKDITIKVSRFPLLSRQPKMPLFLCQISSNLCNRAHTVPLNCENTLKSTSSTSPEDIFKNIIPHFIKQMPTVPLLPAGGNIIKERFRTTEEREISQEITKSEIVTFTEPFNTGSKTSQITELENGDTSEDTLSYSEMFTETENVGDSSENKEVFGSSTPETINIFTAVGNISNNKYDNEEFTETGSIVFTENSESEQSGKIEYTPLTGPPLQITSLEEESSVSLREETDESTTSLKNIFDNNHSLEVRGSTDIPNEYLSTVISMGVELPISSSEETNGFTSMEEENESEPLTELENKTPSKEELDLSIPIEGIYRNETPVTIDVLSLLTEGTSKDLISTMSMSIAYSNVLGTGLTSAKENTETKTSVEVEESNTLTQEISESLASGSFQPSTTEETKHHLEHKSKSKPPTNIEEITQLRNETPESLSSEENMSRDSSTEASNGLTTETMSYIENEFETNPSYEMEQSTQLRKETSKTSDSLKSTAMTQLKSEITTNLKQETSEGSVSQSFESSASSTEETINNKKNKSESEPSTEIEESTEFREGTSETLRFMELISRASTTESSDGFTPLLENKSEAMTSVESEISTNLTRENSESSVSESFELSAPSTEETINYIENKSESEPSTEIEESTEFREGTSETLRFMELISRASSTESSDGFTPLLENKSVAMASVESEISTNLTPENSESSVSESFESSASSTEETINYIENKSESEPSTEIEESTEFREGTSETLRFMELISRASTTESSDGFTPLLENKSEAMTSVESEISTNLTPENSESSVSESFESSASSTEKTVNYIENKSKSEPSTEIEVSTKLKEETSETLSSRELISRASSTESPKVFTPIMENTSEAKTSVESEISTNLTQETSEGSVSESFEIISIFN
ncbi:mucin-16-like [Homalodisca vitripennis]|uniref:mucin-16-like n=1 Tax=Homalodisca vitripennis TaxID=197043 RepID=UPI001EEC3EFE|nr:mucin-16-like [Homalodisca vitripennis]